MADPTDNDRPGDDVLVAFIDGELGDEERAGIDALLAADAELRARLEALKRGGRRFAEAFEVLLAAAPAGRLNAVLASAAHSRAAPPRGWRRLAAIAAAVAIFVAGAAVGSVAPRLWPGKPVEVAQAPAPGWRQVVAEYLVLTTSDTLSIIPESPAILSDELTAIGAKLGIELSADKLALPHVYLKQAQLFEFRGRPLAQIAYLSRDDGPVAFCIIANGQPDAGPAFEQREGSNIVFWTKDGRGFMLIGKAPRQTLEQLAGELAAHVS
ncbi:MAG: anti-sigma factor [Bauldia sp.]